MLHLTANPCNWLLRWSLHPLAMALWLPVLAQAAVLPAADVPLSEPMVSASSPATEASSAPDALTQGAGQQPSSPIQNEAARPVPRAQRAGEDWARLGYVERTAAEPRLDTRAARSPSCLGQWLPLMPAALDAAAPADSATELWADRAYHDPVSGSELSGHVEMNQTGRRLQADQLQLDAEQRMATAKGHVTLSENGLTTYSDQLSFDLHSRSGLIENTRYASSALQAHGQAASILQLDPDHLQLNGVTYTTCDPQQPTWQLHAASLNVDQRRGRATLRDSTLRIQQVPVLRLPWLEFPTDDRRSSGFLLPRPGHTNGGGIELSLPYYFNLAPNYDLTLTPRLISDRGLMLESEVRWLAANGLDLLARGGWLPDDHDHGGDSRQQLSVRSAWPMTPHLRAELKGDYVSDEDYFADLGNDPLVRTPSYQERSLALISQDWIAGLDATLRVQDFQVVDRSIADSQRPYKRLPQLLVNYARDQGLGWSWDTQQDLAYFKKPITDGSTVERSGLRLYQAIAGQYRLQNSWGYLQPAVQLRHLYTYYDQASQTSQGIDRRNASQTVLVPQLTVDGGLVFERSGRYQQFLEPRAFYAYAPHREQSHLPSFDTVAASFGYSQLFSPYRFIGHDRLEDNHFVSLGLTHRLYAADGIERVRTSIGQRFNLRDPQVRLNPVGVTQTPTAPRIGPALDLSVHLNEGLHLESTTLWSGSAHTAQSIQQLVYQDALRIYQLGWFSRRDLPGLSQRPLHQLTFGMVQPLGERWRLFGSLQYDTDASRWRDNLIGADYDSCCMRLSVYSRRYYNDLDDPQSTRPRHAIMAELTLKGLGGLSGDLSGLLRQKILGYSQVEKSWNSR